MKIDFRLTQDDHVVYQTYSASKSQLHKNKIRNSKIIMSICYLLIGAVLSWKDENYAGIIIFGIVAIIWFVLYPTYYKWRVKASIKKHVAEQNKNYTHQDSYIEFHSDYLKTQEGTMESKINASELKSMSELPEHFFIHLKANAAIVIPKYAIDDLATFKKRITEYQIKSLNEKQWNW